MLNPKTSEIEMLIMLSTKFKLHLQPGKLERPHAQSRGRSSVSAFVIGAVCTIHIFFGVMMYWLLCILFLWLSLCTYFITTLDCSGECLTVFVNASFWLDVSAKMWFDFRMVDMQYASEIQFKVVFVFIIFIILCTNGGLVMQLVWSETLGIGLYIWIWRSKVSLFFKSLLRNNN